MSNSSNYPSIQTAIAWCLAWGDELEPRYPIETFNRWRQAIAQGEMPADAEWQQALSQAESLAQLDKTNSDFSLEAIAAFAEQHPQLCEDRIGLVYGGVTKVKSYVFESADLQEIRGASALLDRINLVDLPAFFSAETAAGNRFRQCYEAATYCRKHIREEWLDKEFETLSRALIPELIIYSTGGNILAFCPTAFTEQLCDAIEKRYTNETLTANSCAVGITCRPLEIHYGLLNHPVDQTPWQAALVDGKTNLAVQAYFGIEENTPSNQLEEALKARKNFGELVGKLTSQFIQRRSGYDLPTTQSLPRPSRRFPPMFETHPYLMRDDSDIRSTVVKLEADELPDEPQLSEPTARKRRVGQIVKRESAETQRWYQNNGFQSLWNPAPTEERIFQSWVAKFENFLKGTPLLENYDKERHLFDQHGDIHSGCEETREARSLHEIGDSSNGYVGYIYADGNSMGQYIREKIRTPAGYQEFSEHIFEATEKSVYRAIAQHIHPHYYTPTAKSSRQPKQKDKTPVWIHPFEIITIGGDDVLLIVPANKVIEVAQAIGEHFEDELLKHGDKYEIPSHVDISQQNKAHRYQPHSSHLAKCRLSTSSGVLITAANTPIYYADKLVSQLLKSAKKHLKSLKRYGYYGGTVDFLVLKAVTMISSDIEAFRKEGLTLSPKDRQHRLKLQAAPYTLHELDGLIKTVRAFKQSSFPKSQLYQIRSLLERGKRTAILNYRYFRVRLPADQRSLIEAQFENAWCKAETNSGNLAPWITPRPKDLTEGTATEQKTEYETIWRELVDLEPFIEAERSGQAAVEITNATVQRPAS
ncbi:type III-B CRISPR-associated protein Cas10/Cmr2 [cf. Phormidesmis sp. LEGE 11477]|uniref:type III-B CRISPR-associated protein Cas10/Cmr2 n=1 Tax=cf. Phormidesmis sp. LEGE 11477 TaxID=1828680 RepID=UPI0018821F01|nr:type III-B CRISPR-associated protein Cas10/Cmr2 [cf. Phormidesmis sp. LEGE 11477]MBE9063120.1 type III-B CRISPR-associated protein Cas10/Cmr2 [cf. Phormidesmis sp. LEGE 11477]